MAGLAHFGIGLASKRLAPEVPVGLLVLASASSDLAWLGCWAVGLEPWGSMPYWSHSLLMSFAWSALAFLIALAIARKWRTALVVGLVAFSHWILDFITHPMGAVMGGGPAEPDIALAFRGSPVVGLGLYNHSAALAMSFDLGLFAIGLLIYVLFAVKRARIKRQAAGLGASGGTN
jgi:hypothetical protein